MRYSRRRLLELSGITLATLAGCVSAPTQDDQRAATPTKTSSPTQTPTPTPNSGTTGVQQQFPNHKWTLLDEATPKVTTRITMTKNLRFRPTIAKVPVGATVTWMNPSPLEHTLVIPQLDVDRRVQGEKKTKVMVSKTGTFDYVCDIHPPKMLGRLIVSKSVNTPTNTATPTTTPTPTPTETPTQSSGKIPKAEGAITIEGSEWKLVPAKFTTQKGRQLNATFKNVGRVAHNLTIGKFPIEKRSAAKQARNEAFMAQTKTIQPGKTASVTVTPNTEGTFPYWCHVSGHRQAGMEGQMIVQ